VQSDFKGYVGIGNSYSAEVAAVASSYAVGTVVEGIFDCNNKYNVAKVTASGKLAWVPATIEVAFADGSSKFYGTLSEALTAASAAEKATAASSAASAELPSLRKAGSALSAEQKATRVSSASSAGLPSRQRTDAGPALSAARKAIPASSAASAELPDPETE
jgi:hypothetical protein